jgi:hypothetical protein
MSRAGWPNRGAVGRKAPVRRRSSLWPISGARLRSSARDGPGAVSRDHVATSEVARCRGYSCAVEISAQRRGATLGDGSPAAGRERLPSIDTTVPHSARFWDYSLGGKDNYPVDREVGEQVLLIDPDLRDGLPRVFWSGPSDTWYWRQASASCLTSAPGCLP